MVTDFSEVTNHIVNMFKVPVLQSYLLFNWSNPAEATGDFPGKLTWGVPMNSGIHKINTFSNEKITTWVLVKILDLRFTKMDSFKQQRQKKYLDL